MIRRQQARAPGHDPMPVMIRIAGKGNIEIILQTDQSAHGVGRGWIHANLAVPIDCHKAESGIDLFAHGFKIQLEALCDRRPIFHSGATEWIHPDMYARCAYRIHIDDSGKITYVIVQEVMLMCRGSAQGIFKTYPSYAGEVI